MEQGLSTAQASEIDDIELKFSRVALFTGRYPLYWHTTESTAFEHARQLCELLQFCLDIPGSQLRAKGDSGDCWINGNAAKAWVETMRGMLEECAPYVRDLPDETILLEMLQSYRCTVFAPFYPEQFL